MAIHSPQKQNQKPFRQSRVLARLSKLSDIPLLVLAYYFLTHRGSENRLIHVRTELAGRVILDTYVTPATEVIVPIWLGDWPNQTQSVAYMRWKDHRKYDQKSKDLYGWVW